MIFDAAPAATTGDLVGDQLRHVHADQLVNRVARHARIGFVALQQAAFLG